MPYFDRLDRPPHHWWGFWQYPGANLPPVAVKMPDGTIEQRQAVVLPQRFDAVIWSNAFRKLVEDKANGPAVIQSLRHEIGGLIEVNPEGGKISRAAAASPQLESGSWHLPHPMLAPWVEEFIGECAAFPAGARMGLRVGRWSAAPAGRIWLATRQST